MKALAVRQPYAWLIVQGFKKVEYRSWLTRYRGPFLVHATKAIDEEEMKQERSLKAREGIVLPDDLPRGGIVGVATLVDCVRYDTVSQPLRFLGRLLGKSLPPGCGDQPESICYGFLLQDPLPLPFVTYRGQQKFFNVPDDLLGPEFEVLSLE